MQADLEVRIRLYYLPASPCTSLMYVVTETMASLRARRAETPLRAASATASKSSSSAEQRLIAR